MHKITLIALTALVQLGFGCGDGDGAAGASGTSGSGGTGGTAEPCTGAATDDPNCINAGCGEADPISGPLAAKGICCFRESNFDRATAAWADGELATLEYRQNALKTSSQPNSVGNPLIQASLADGYKNEWSNTIVRIEGVPETGSATVTLTIGSGHPNCDGTFSFFDGAAPDHEGRTDGDRWNGRPLMGTWDWDATEMLVIDDSTRPAGVTWSPVAKTHGEFGYEQPAQNLNYAFEFSGTPGMLEPDDLNCGGGKLNGTMWETSIKQTVFFPVAELKGAFVNSSTLQQNFCGFMALGYMAGNDCDAVAQVDWVEKPIGMCDAERCYVGDAVHPDADCGGTTGNECCDPTGVSTTMPACNAFYIEATAAIGAAEITDEPYTDSAVPYENCTL